MVWAPKFGQYSLRSHLTASNSKNFPGGAVGNVHFYPDDDWNYSPWIHACTVITYLLQRGNITVTSISRITSWGSASTIDCTEWSRFSTFHTNSDCTDFNSQSSSSGPQEEGMLGEAINPQMNRESVAIDIHYPCRASKAMTISSTWERDWIPLWRVYSNFRCLRYALKVASYSKAHLFLQLERECHHNNQECWP